MRGTVAPPFPNTRVRPYITLCKPRDFVFTLLCLLFLAIY